MKVQCPISHIRSIVKTRKSSLKLNHDVYRLLWLDYLIFLKRLCATTSKTMKESFTTSSSSSSSQRAEASDVLATKKAMKLFCYQRIPTTSTDSQGSDGPRKTTSTDSQGSDGPRKTTSTDSQGCDGPRKKPRRASKARSKKRASS